MCSGCCKKIGKDIHERISVGAGSDVCMTGVWVRCDDSIAGFHLLHLEFVGKDAGRVLAEASSL